MTNKNQKIERMLVVDDTPENIESAKKAFEGKYGADYVNNYSKAMDSLNKEKYDVVLTDLLMPKEGDLERRTKDFIDEISEPKLRIPSYLDIGLNKVSEKDVEKIAEYNRYCAEFYKNLSNKGVYGELLDSDKLPKKWIDYGEILDIVDENKGIDKRGILNKIKELSNKCSTIWGERDWYAKSILKENISDDIKNFNDSIINPRFNCTYKDDTGKIKKGLLSMGTQSIEEEPELVEIYLPDFDGSNIIRLRDSNLLRDNLGPAGYFISENCAEKGIPVGILSHMGRHATHAYLMDYFLSSNPENNFDKDYAGYDTATYDPKKGRLFRTCNNETGKTPQEWDYTLKKLLEKLI
jgi:hypothetical protein